MSKSKTAKKDSNSKAIKPKFVLPPGVSREEYIEEMKDLIEQIEGTKEGLPPKYILDPTSKMLTPKGDIGRHHLKNMKVTGSKSFDFAESLVSQILDTTTTKAGDPDEMKVNGALAALSGIAPKDELEGMLGAQMIATHRLAMDFIGRAILNTDVNLVSTNVERATKMMRTFISQIETLNRYRCKGQQKVIVEHVTVNQGGQAVIGVVENHGGGGGSEESLRQPTSCKAEQDLPNKKSP